MNMGITIRVLLVLELRAAACKLSTFLCTHFYLDSRRLSSGEECTTSIWHVAATCCLGLHVGLSIESMHYMMSSTLYRVHWSKIHYTESRSPLSFDQLHPAAQSPIRSTLFLQVPYSRSRSPENKHLFSFACLVAAHSFLHFSHGCQFCCAVADSNLSRGNQGG